MADFTLEDNIFHFFTTRTTTGAPTTLVNGEVKVLEDGKSAGVSPSTAGATLTADFNGITGLNRLLISANAAHGYANASQYSAYLSIGSVGSVNVTGEVVYAFTIGKSAAVTQIGTAGDGLTALASAGAATSIIATLGTAGDGLTAVASAGAVTSIINTLGTAGDGLTALASAGAVTSIINTLGAAGAGLTAIPTVGGLLTISAAALASMNAEMDTAIQDASLASAGSLSSLATAGAVAAISTTLGAAGAGLTAIPTVGGLLTISAAALASMNSEMDTAIQDANLASAGTISALNDLSAGGIFTSVVTESFSSVGDVATFAQMLHEIRQGTLEFAISGTTVTVKKADRTTTAATYTLDDASTPTSRTRAT